MSIKSSIPERVLENPDTSKFVEVVSSLQDYKQDIVFKSLRVNNPALLTDKKWLIKMLGDYGLPNFPYDFPVAIMAQLLLNIDQLFRTRGSKIGIEFFCSVLSLGEVSVDDSNFYLDPINLLLDSLEQGYVTADTTKDFFYLTNDTEQLNQPVSLVIYINSKYFNGSYPTEATVIKEFIETNIVNFIAYSPYREITFTYGTNTDFYFHKLLNPYFV